MCLFQYHKCLRWYREVLITQSLDLSFYCVQIERPKHLIHRSGICLYTLNKSVQRIVFSKIYFSPWTFLFNIICLKTITDFGCNWASFHGQKTKLDKFVIKTRCLGLTLKWWRHQFELLKSNDNVCWSSRENFIWITYHLVFRILLPFYFVWTGSKVKLGHVGVNGLL